VASGQHPHLAAALINQPPDATAAQHEQLLDRTMKRIVTGLLPPAIS
jgi:hypothetical protein